MMIRHYALEIKAQVDEPGFDIRYAKLQVKVREVRLAKAEPLHFEPAAHDGLRGLAVVAQMDNRGVDPYGIEIGFIREGLIHRNEAEAMARVLDTVEHKLLQEAAEARLQWQDVPFVTVVGGVARAIGATYFILNDVVELIDGGFEQAVGDWTKRIRGALVEERDAAHIEARRQAIKQTQGEAK